MKPGHVLLTIRVQCDLSLREVAAAAGLSAVELGRIERNVVSLTPEQALALYSIMARLVEARDRPRLLAAAARFLEAQHHGSKR